MKKISAVIITKNEERNIERCLQSVQWVDEVVVVDSGSIDNTLDICRKYKCIIVETDWLGFGKTKQLSIESASNDWVLSIDADEEVTEELKTEIITTLSQDKIASGYKIKWLSYYVNSWIRHSGWNKNYKIKLFNRNHGKFNDSMIHERVIIEGEVVKLKNVLRHHTYPDLKTFLLKTESYAQTGAQVKFDEGKSGSLLTAYIHGAVTFFKMYIIKAGFLDGKIGLILATNYAFAVYYKYLKLWEMQTNNQKSS